MITVLKYLAIMSVKVKETLEYREKENLKMHKIIINTFSKPNDWETQILHKSKYVHFIIAEKANDVIIINKVNSESDKRKGAYRVKLRKTMFS